MLVYQRVPTLAVQPLFTRTQGKNDEDQGGDQGASGVLLPGIEISTLIMVVHGGSINGGYPYSFWMVYKGKSHETMDELD